jgi:voltage-gated sodium channel
MLKVCAEELSPWMYFSDSWNMFDFSVVVVSFVPAGANSSTFTVFRLLRLLRVLKLAKVVPDLQVIVVSVLRCATSIVYILLVLLIFYYFFALIGVTLFATNDPWHFEVRTW